MGEHEIEKKTRLEKKHSISALKKFESCERKMDQSSALDQTDITITYSRTLPAEVYSHTKTLNTLVKVALFPYVYQVSEPSQTSQTLINLKFDQKTNTVSMELESPIDTVYFKNVRLPTEMREIIPLVARKSPVEQTYKALTGTSLLAKCVLGQGYVQTYDKKAYSYQIDECDHLITSDCSRDLTHAILAKEVNGHKHVTIFEGETKIEVSPAQSYQNYVEDWTLEVDGKKVSLNKNEEKTLENECTVYWHSDNVVEINTPHARITHKGRTVSVEEKTLMADGSHCGLCGDYNMDQRADIKSPKECVLSSDKLSAYSYRVKSDQCKPLSKTISEETSLRRRSASSTPPRTPRSAPSGSPQRPTSTPRGSTPTSTRRTRSVSPRTPSSTAPPAPLPRTSAGSPSSTSASPRAAWPSSTRPGSSAESLLRS